jgi:DSF synthase
MSQMEFKPNAVHNEISSFSQLNVRYEHGQAAMYYALSPRSRPCFNPELLTDIQQFQKLVRDYKTEKSHCTSIWSGVKYLVLCSDVPGVFSLGGDLVLFREAIQNRDRETLWNYAQQCVDVLYRNSVDLDLPLTTISMVQGRALGGGLEAALSSTVVIAERSAQMGLPEIHFSLFPGMGAYQLIARRIGPILAERFIKSGRMYSASELYDMGLVDEIAPDGAGPMAIADYIKRQNAVCGAYEAIHRTRRIAAPIPYEDLLQVAHIWVDTAMSISKRDLRVMERFARSQNRLSLTSSGDANDPVGDTALPAGM